MERSIGYTVIQSQVSSKIYDALNINERAPITIKPSIISKEGRLEHIVRKHKEDINDSFLNAIKETLENPTKVQIEQKNNEIVLKSHIYKKGNKTYDFVIVLNGKNNQLNLLTAFKAYDNNYLKDRADKNKKE